MAHFGATVDVPDKVKLFATKLGVDYPLLTDPSRKVAKAYGVVKDDTSFATRWTFYIGLDGRILFIDKAVSPANHGQAVVDKLGELGVAHRSSRKR